MDGNSIIRHLVATIWFRMDRVITDAPQSFGSFHPGEGVRTPCEIVHHVADILGLAYRSFVPEAHYQCELMDFEAEIMRFHHTVEQLDDVLERGIQPQKLSWEQLVQGPLADALTHIGQLATLRRLMGYPMEPVSYLKADVRIRNAEGE